MLRKLIQIVHKVYKNIVDQLCLLYRIGHCQRLYLVLDIGVK